MGDYINILNEWESNIEKYPKIKIKEARKMYLELCECMDDNLKKQLRNNLITSTLYVVIKFVKNSGLIYLHSSSYDMSDIISVCIEAWINKIDSGILLNINSFNDVFDSEFYNNISNGLNITRYSLAENTILDINTFMDLFYDYIRLKERNGKLSYNELIDFVKFDRRYQSRLNRIYFYEHHVNFVILFDAIIDSFELMDEDLKLSKTRLEKMKYIIMSNGLEYLNCNIDKVVCSDVIDLLINNYCMKEFYKIIFEGDRLSDIQKDIIKKRFGFYDGRNWNLEEVAKCHGVTRERIRQREAKILRLLRYPSFAKKYKELV